MPDPCTPFPKAPFFKLIAEMLNARFKVRNNPKTKILGYVLSSRCHALPVVPQPRRRCGPRTISVCRLYTILSWGMKSSLMTCGTLSRERTCSRQRISIHGGTYLMAMNIRVLCVTVYIFREISIYSIKARGLSLSIFSDYRGTRSIKKVLRYRAHQT